MKIYAALGSFAALTFLLAIPVEAKRELQCKPLGWDKAKLLELRTNKFAIADDDKRQKFALALLNCVGNPDPDLRDKIAYEGFASMLRKKQLDPATIKTVAARLTAALYKDTYGVDPQFERPFAALILSEVVRADRVEAMFTPIERQNMVDAATDYMKSITDYRGFDEREGWRHGVAHTADVFLQLSLNENIDADQLRMMRDAVESQITPKQHFYIYGEPRRLARPILFSASRGLISAEDWADWFKKLGDPAPLNGWGEAYQSQSGLARLHNLKAFANIIYIGAANSKDPSVRVLIEPSLALIQRLP